MFSLPIGLLELQRGDRTIASLKSAIEEAIHTASIDAKNLLEQLETSMVGHGVDPKLRDELTSCILNAETARLTRIRTIPAGAAEEDDVTRIVPRSDTVVGVGYVIKNRFILEEEIGRGGMSQVFKAIDRRREEAGSRHPYVALKIMTVHGGDYRNAFIAMQREAQRSQLLNHPGIVRVHDFDQDGTIVYTTMELLSGAPLDKLIRAAGAIPDAQASTYIAGVADALSHAHDKGLVHADLKPSNVFITDQNEVKLIDFGIARALPKPGIGGNIETVFDARHQLGALTPAYASPEMLRDGDADPRDDIYSFGCIAYEMYMGRTPFAGVDAERARASGMVPQKPEGLSRNKWLAIQRSLAFEREERTPDVRAFVAEFFKRDSESIGPSDIIKDRFELLEEIGSGGMGRVFKAIDHRRQEASSRIPHVALKLLSMADTGFQEGFVAMQREAQRCQMLNHPGIVRVYDFDLDGEIAFMTMELLQGHPLTRTIEEAGGHGLPLETGIDFVTRIAKALVYAHGRGIVHADLKPGNIFVTTSGEVKVIDFGIARAIQLPGAAEGDKTIYDPRLALGAVSPAYASPEMFDGSEPDPRDDVYSLACTAYEIFTGTRPFPNALRARVEHLEPARPARLNEAQWQAIRHGLTLDRTERTVDVQAFLDEFNATPASRRSRKGFLLAGVSAAAAAVAIATVVAWWPPADTGLGATAVQDCADCPLLRVVPAGRFTLGLPESARATYGSEGFFEYPERAIAITAAFAMGAHEVTVGEFRAFADAVDRKFDGCRTPSSDWQVDPGASWSNPGFALTDMHPVTCVSWSDATAYVAWLSSTTGERYRLPSEAEWELVARQHAGVVAPEIGTGACTGGNLADRMTLAEYPGLDALDCSDDFAHTAPVDRDVTSAFTDLQGNVFEWTDDCWVANHADRAGDGTAHRGGDCTERVLRGASWFSAANEARPTFRNRFEQDYRSNTIGFRVAREMQDVKN